MWAINFVLIRLAEVAILLANLVSGAAAILGISVASSNSISVAAPILLLVRSIIMVVFRYIASSRACDSACHMFDSTIVKRSTISCHDLHQHLVIAAVSDHHDRHADIRCDARLFIDTRSDCVGRQPR